jgi:paraquat-inducible protein B
VEGKIMSDSEIPQAKSQPLPKTSWSWALPLLALILVIALGLTQIKEAGIKLIISFDQGHNIKVGDSLKYRGIVIGEIKKVSLTKDLNKVTVEISLDKKARAVAKSESLFWVVRPSISLKGAQALDTIIGAQYITVKPGEGQAQFSFEGLSEAPILAEPLPGGREITLVCSKRGSLIAGASVSYRQISVGKVLSVELAENASYVEVQIYVGPKHQHLIQDHSKFWKTEGFKMSAGWIRGLDVQLGSASTLLQGGVSFITQPVKQKDPKKKDRYKLYEEPEKSWLK